MSCWLKYAMSFPRYAATRHCLRRPFEVFVETSHDNAHS